MISRIHAVILAGTVVTLLGCEPTGAAKGQPWTPGKREHPLFGLTTPSGPDADASDLTTASIAGTVVEVWLNNHDDSFTECTGVLVARNRVLTATPLR